MDAILALVQESFANVQIQYGMLFIDVSSLMLLLIETLQAPPPYITQLVRDAQK